MLSSENCLYKLSVTDLRHLFAVGLGVERRLGEQDRVLLGRDTQLVVERVVPDLLHVVPVGDDAVLDRVLERQDTALALRLVADVAVLLTHTDHHALPTQRTHDRAPVLTRLHHHSRHL